MKPVYFFKKIVMQHYIALEHHVLREQELSRQEFFKDIDNAIHLSLAREEVKKLQAFIEEKEKSIQNPIKHKI